MGKIERIVVPAGDREKLERLVRDRNTPQKVVWRCRIVLLSGEGVGATEVAARAGKSAPTVRRWRRRFEKAGVSGLLKDATRPPRVKPMTPGTIARVVEMTLRHKPPNATNWSLRTMAKAAGVSRTSVQRIWKAHGLKPHLTRTFKLSRDPKFSEKLADVVGLYLDPPDKAIVLAVDGKSQIQALDRTQPGLPMKKGRAATMTHDCKRHGNTTLFAALNVLDGTVIGTCVKRHRSREFLNFLKLIDRQTTKGLDLHLIVDNHATRNSKLIEDLAGEASTLPSPFHTDIGLVAQSGGTLLCRNHPRRHPQRGLQKRRRTGSRHHEIPRNPQCRPQAIYLDKVGGPDSRKNRPSETSVGVTTLASVVTSTGDSQIGQNVRFLPDGQDRTHRCAG